MGVVEGGVTGEILIPKGEWITGCPPGGEGEGKGRGLGARAGVDWREDRAGERELTDWGADKGALTGVPAWDFCGEDGCFGVLEEDDEDEDEDEDEFELDDGEATMGESHDVDAEDGAGVGESRLMTSPNAFDDMGWGESHSLSVSESSSELIVKSITSILGFFGAGPEAEEEEDLDSLWLDLWAAGLQEITWCSFEVFNGLHVPSSWNWISFMSEVSCNISTKYPSMKSRWNGAGLSQTGHIQVDFFSFIIR